MSFWENMNANSEFQPGEDQQQATEPVVPNSAASKASNTQAGGSNGDKERPTEPPPNPSLKRLACDACRERKVRCDRQYPTCARCSRMNHNCNYSGPSKSAASKVDLSQFLMSLTSRLVQAEAQLAFTGPTLNMNQYAAPWGDPSAAPITTSAEAVSASQVHDLPNGLNMPVENLNNSPNMGDAMMLELGSEWTGQPIENVDNSSFDNLLKLNQQASDNSSLQFSGMASTISADFSTSRDTSKTMDHSHLSHDSSSSSNSEARSQSISTISADIFSRLHASYFDVFNPVMPIVNQARFQMEMAQMPYTIEVQALSNAIGALGAIATPESACCHETCYNQARDLLDICERQENGGTLININTLQTCVLLTLYEFKRTNFARAWMTLGRGIRLGKMMGLDRIDDYSAMPGLPGLHLPLPPTSNPAELEERRRTFWLLYVLDAFAGIKTNSLPAIDEAQISVPLPSPGELSDISDSSTMPSLQQVSEHSEYTYLSPFAGTIVMISLYRRCFDHIQASHRQAPLYPFWVTHYRIDRSIRDCRSNLVTQNLTTQNANDPLSLTLRMNLAAVEISLHETAITKVEQEQLPAALSVEAITRCQGAANEIGEAVQVGQKLLGRQLEAFRQSSLFFIWPITMAIQACFHMLSCRENDVSMHINSLRILSSSMKALIDPEHIPAALLEMVDNRIAEAERLEKKRKRIWKANN